MKTIIAISLLALSGSTLAYDASWDANEFYEGSDTPLVGAVTLGAVDINDNLYREGNFPETTPGTAGPIEMSHTIEPADLYLEGNYDV